MRKLLSAAIIAVLVLFGQFGAVGAQEPYPTVEEQYTSLSLKRALGTGPFAVTIREQRLYQGLDPALLIEMDGREILLWGDVNREMFKIVDVNTTSKDDTAIYPWVLTPGLPKHVLPVIKTPIKGTLSWNPGPVYTGWQFIPKGGAEAEAFFKFSRPVPKAYASSREMDRALGGVGKYYVEGPFYETGGRTHFRLRASTNQYWAIILPAGQIVGACNFFSVYDQNLHQFTRPGSGWIEMKEGVFKFAPVWSKYPCK